MNTPASERIPVRDANGTIIDRIDSARARRLAQAPNAKVIRQRKSGEIVGISLQSVGDDSAESGMIGNPSSYSHNHENDTNPEKVWTLKTIPSSTADIFGAVVNELVKRAA